MWIAVIATIGWIGLDIIISVATAPAMSPVAWWILLIGGVALGAIALIAEIKELVDDVKKNAAHDGEIQRLTTHHDQSIARLEATVREAEAKTAGRIDVLTLISTETHRTVQGQLPYQQSSEGGFEGDLTQISVRRGEVPNRTVVYLGLSIRNLGRASAVHDWSVNYVGTSLTSNVLMDTQFNELGQMGRNLAFDEEVYPERGIRNGFLALSMSNDAAKGILDLRTSRIDVRFKDVAGNPYFVYWPSLEIRKTFREQQIREGKGNDN